jgi:hypothetical protein
MGNIIIGLVGLIVGAVLGAFIAAPVMSGAAAGVGVATGLSAGICSTVQAAQEEGLLTAEQVDQVLTRAAADMSALAGETAPEDVVGGLDDCAAVMERLRAAQ